jgi:nucleotide-binding universal stress UspA family protein
VRDPGAPLVAGYDGSEDAAGAIASAGRLLSPRRTLVVHSYVGLSRLLLRSDPPVRTGPLAEAVKELRADDAAEAERVAAEGAQVAIAAGLDAQPLVVEQDGKPWRTLLALADEHQAAAIVAGARGRGAISSALLGSTSAGLVHHSRRPVLVVPATANGEPPAGPALLCYDGSEDAEHAIAAAGGLLASKEARVMTLWPDWLEQAPSVPLVGGAVAGMARELNEVARNQSAELAERGKALAVNQGLEANAMSGPAEGPLWRNILGAAAECDASVIALGSRGLSGLSSVLGSVSYGVIHNSHRPVLVVPPGE